MVDCVEAGMVDSLRPFEITACQMDTVDKKIVCVVGLSWDWRRMTCASVQKGFNL